MLNQNRNPDNLLIDQKPLATDFYRKESIIRQIKIIQKRLSKLEMRFPDLSKNELNLMLDLRSRIEWLKEEYSTLSNFLV